MSIVPASDAAPTVPSLPDLLREPNIGCDVGRTLLAIRLMLRALEQQQNLQPSVTSALALVLESAEIAGLLALMASVGTIVDNEFGRVVADARKVLAGEVSQNKGNPVLGQGGHWNTVANILEAVEPAFSAAAGDEKLRVASEAACAIEQFVGKRPSPERTAEALSVLHQRSRPRAGQRPKSAVMVDLLNECGLATASKDPASIRSMLSRRKRKG